MKKFICTKSTPSSKGGFINTLQCKSVKSIGMLTQETSETYYIKTVSSVPVNTSMDLDIEEMFNVTVNPYETVDTVTGEVIIIPCKWLRMK